ncbi:membrane-bound PQQ-dependent dehydrogenase, glucose/quinate/shikimate family [Alcaligenaceae bacterium]|nr:membrane-bound PQQ-dependent dehydrogenase, glucose/quinate/shikimate family [Alcaligenaceae bacterium]
MPPPHRHTDPYPRTAGVTIARGAVILGAVLALLLGLVMAGWGAWLVLLGGNWYYMLAGLGFAAAGVLLLWRRESVGMAVLSCTVLATVLWSFWEIHGKGWMQSWGFDLAGRIGLPLGILLLLVIAATFLRRRQLFSQGKGTPPLLWLTSTLAVLLAGVVLGVFRQEPQFRSTFAAASLPTGPAEAAALGGRSAVQRGDDEWTAYGGSNLGQRFSPAAQINPGNVARLEEAWRFRTNDHPPNDRVYYSFQNTPLKIDDSLYVCSNSNQVFALDPGTGEQQWHFDPRVSPEAMEPLFSVACRAVAYHEAPAEAEPAECPRRILLATQDSRLIALDADTGLPCPGFGRQGTVDLGEGMANQAPGLSSTTAGPAVVGDLVVVGQQVSDNQRQDAPSGVVRAFDVMTGEFSWAWDAKRTDRTQEPLAPGEIWPRGTPNVWNVISADEELGLVYLPTGNPANDHYGGNRDPEDDEYTAAVVAVDALTGEARWHFRTVDHDLWDYDIGAQPVLMDMDIDGAMRRVVLIATKTGSLFVLDAASGVALRPVERVPAPQGTVPGDWTAADQPQSVAFPNLAGRPGPHPERLDASYAFGLTPVDALYCRLQFERMRYEGIYTPPTDEGLGMLLFPGTIGGPNWGGIAVDQDRQVVVTNHSRLPNRVQLVARDEVEDLAIGDGGARPDQVVAPQAGTPYGVDRPMWLSPLGVPCISPPWGYLAATDLRTGSLLWSQPLGTGYDIGPLGIPTRLKLTIGTPNVGGPVATRSGLTFIAAAQDNFLRAFETTSGALLWEGRLPNSAQSGALTYMHNGRQYVAVAAGGHARLETEVGDSLVVFALAE